MFILKAHIAIGILLYLIHVGNVTLFRKRMEERLYYINPKRKKAGSAKKILAFVNAFLACMIPIYNLFIIITECIVLFADDDILDKFKDKENS